MKLYGHKAVIGLISPSGGAAEEDFHRLAPEGVAISTTRIPLERAVPSELMKLSEYVNEASILLKPSEPDVIILGCTSGSFIKGKGYDEEIIRVIEQSSGVAGITTSTAILQALKHLKVRNISIATPYIDEVNEIERHFFKDHGFEVLSIGGLQLGGNKNVIDIPNLKPDEMYEFAKNVFDPSSDALFISCTGIGVISIIDKLEKELKKPIIASNQASVWACLRITGVNEIIKGYGMLMQS